MASLSNPCTYANQHCSPDNPTACICLLSAQQFSAQKNIIIIIIINLFTSSKNIFYKVVPQTFYLILPKLCRSIRQGAVPNDLIIAMHVSVPYVFCMPLFWQWLLPAPCSCAPPPPLQRAPFETFDPRLVSMQRSVVEARSMLYVIYLLSRKSNQNSP